MRDKHIKLLFGLSVLIICSCKKADVTQTHHAQPQQVSRIDLLVNSSVDGFLSYHLFPASISDTGRIFTPWSTYPIQLPEDTSLSVHIEFYDANDNQVFFLGSAQQTFWVDSGCSLEFENWMVDADNNPMGIWGVLNTGSPATGTLSLVGKYNLDKFAPGVSDGDITNADGELIYKVTFDIVIE